MTNFLNQLKEELDEIHNKEKYPDFTPIEIAKHFAKYESDIEEYKRVMKKLKRKKIEFDPFIFNSSIKHLEAKEAYYFEKMTEMFATKDEEEKAFLIEDLSWMIYNRFGMKQSLLDYEMKVTYGL